MKSNTNKKVDTIKKNEKMNEGNYPSRLASSEKNKQWTYVSGFDGYTTKCLHFCDICEEDELISPNNAMMGKGGPCCRRRQTIEKNFVTLEQHLELIKERQDVKYLKGYNGASELCWYTCLKCDTPFEAQAYSVANKGTGCDPCGYKKMAISNQVTLEEHLKLLENLPVSYIKGFINGSDKCLHQCDNCPHKWLATYTSLKQRNLCPECANKNHNVIYLWDDDLKNTKIGVTKEALGNRRHKEVAAKRKTKIHRPLQFKTNKAKCIENIILELPLIRPYDSGSGYKEFRSFTKHQRAVIASFLSTLATVLEPSKTND